MDLNLTHGHTSVLFFDIWKLSYTMSRYWLEKSSMSATTENSRTRKAMSLLKVEVLLKF